MPLAAAQDGLFPRQFAQVSGSRKTPVVGLVASSVLLSGLMAMNYQSSLTDTFTKIIILATLTTLVPYAFAAAAQLMLMFREPERFSGRRLALDATIAVLAFGVLLLDDLRRRPGVHRPGLPAADGGHPRVRVHQVAPGQDEGRDAAAESEFATNGTDRRSQRLGCSPCSPVPTRRPPDGRPPRPPSASTPKQECFIRCWCTDRDTSSSVSRRATRMTLLFDDVIWVKRARQEHDAFVDALVMSVASRCSRFAAC